MRFFALIFVVGVAQCGLVKRDAEAKAESKADPGYKSVSAPQCRSVPEKQCKQRNIEKPKNVCHEEFDEIVDTTYTEHCKEVITTECVQVAEHTRHSSAVVGQDSKVVATGVGATAERIVSHGPISHTGYSSYGSSLYKKREAEAEAEPKADPAAVADAEAAYGYTSGHVKSAPRCNSTPVKTCEKVPHEKKRRIAKTLCKEVVDIATIEDCEIVTTTQCTQEAKHVERHSAVVGHDTRVGPSAVVATQHAGTVVSSPVVASYGSRTYSTGLGSIRRVGGYGRY